MKNNRATFMCLVSIGLLLMVGCGTSRSIKKEEVSVKKDSVRVEIKIVREKYDSIVYVPAAASTIIIDNPCDSLMHLKPVNISIKKGSSSLRVSSKNNQLIIEDSCDAKVNRLQRIIDSVSTTSTGSVTNVSTSSVSDKEVKKIIPLWCWTVMISEGIIILLMSYLFIKFKFNFL